MQSSIVLHYTESEQKSLVDVNFVVFFYNKSGLLPVDLIGKLNWLEKWASFIFILESRETDFL